MIQIRWGLPERELPGWDQLWQWMGLGVAGHWEGEAQWQTAQLLCLQPMRLPHCGRPQAVPVCSLLLRELKPELLLRELKPELLLRELKPELLLRELKPELLLRELQPELLLLLEPMTELAQPVPQK